jgi:cytochrome c-type biogenesis protein CcmH
VTVRRLAVLAAVIGMALAAARPSSAQTAADSLLEREVRAVAAELRCPVCQGLSILDSPSELAQDMKKLVREKLVAGATPTEVRAYFVERYGEWVLLKPPARGANLTVWLLPAVALLGGGLALWIAVRRWTHEAREPAGEGSGVSGAAPDVTGTPVELRARRDALRQMLLELEADFADGKVLERDYEALRQRDEAELAALNAAIKEAKKGRAAAPAPAAATSGTPARRRRLPPAAAWAIALVAFGGIAALSLRGALAPRQAGQTITGIAFGPSGGEGAAEPGEDTGGPLGMEAVDSVRLAQLEGRVARDSNDYPALLELSHLYMRQQRLSRAADISLRAVKLRPEARETAEAFAHLGMVLWSANELTTGLRAIEQALFLHPDLPEALLYKGIMLFAGAGDPQGAVAAWERYLQVAPPGAETQRVRGMLQAARQSME